MNLFTQTALWLGTAIVMLLVVCSDLQPNDSMFVALGWTGLAVFGVLSVYRFVLLDGVMDDFNSGVYDEGYMLPVFMWSNYVRIGLSCAWLLLFGHYWMTLIWLAPAVLLCMRRIEANAYFKRTES